MASLLTWRESETTIVVVVVLVVNSGQRLLPLLLLLSEEFEILRAVERLTVCWLVAWPLAVSCLSDRDRE